MRTLIVVIAVFGFAAGAWAQDAPADATVLIGPDGKFDLVGEGGKALDWKTTVGGAVVGNVSALSKVKFSSAQIHAEFNLPEGDTKQRGNSGLYIHSLYEVQVLDSFNPNKYEDAQQCAALYKYRAPLKNVCRKPGQWQTYDIIFHGAKLDAEGKRVEPARITVIHNGVLVHDNVTLPAGTGAAKKKPLVAEGPLKLQAHGSRVRFRNVWIRPINRPS